MADGTPTFGRDASPGVLAATKVVRSQQGAREIAGRMQESWGRSVVVEKDAF